MNSPKKTIAIIGGGAAGMMAAAALIESKKECDIHIFDANKNLGVKVIISGGGRCNVTTGLRDPHKLKKQYTRGSDFLKAALSKLTPKGTYDWFEKNGVLLKIEDDLRVFPQSNDGKDVVGVFENMFKKHQVIIHFQSRVTHISKSDKQFTITTNKETMKADVVVIATGGNAYRKTGSQGDGYHFAESLGHSITKLGPSLNSFFTEEEWPKQLSGITLPNAQLTTNPTCKSDFKVGLTNKKIRVSGPFLFTHFGISGPVTFAFSSHITFSPISKEHQYKLNLHPNANISPTQWRKILTTNIKTKGKKFIKTILNEYLPKRLTESLLQQTDIHPNTKLADITSQKRKTLLHLLENGLPLTLTQRRPGDEFVTAGGVNTDEINPQTMESNITSELYFVGEVMNIDGVTGGFNLQSSWATGQLAGKSIAKKL